MSKSAGSVSAKGQEENQNRSVFDFIYYDSRRVGSYLGQIYDAGLLEKLTETETVGKVVQRGMKLSIGGGATVLGTGGNATIGVERGPGENGSEQSQRVYDPFWTNARTFLDYLDGNGLINTDLSSTPVGRFVYLKGDLTVIDLSIVEKTWGMKNFQTLMSANLTPSTASATGNREQRRKERSIAGATPKMPNEIDVLVDLLRILPHTAQAYFKAPGVLAWCGLKEDALITQPGDLLLKHGIAIEGEWGVLGILDAKPDQDNSAGTAEHMQELGLGADLGRGVAAAIMASISPMARGMLGRPEHAFGLTPLLIFREVSG